MIPSLCFSPKYPNHVQHHCCTAFFCCLVTPAVVSWCTNDKLVTLLQCLLCKALSTCSHENLRAQPHPMHPDLPSPPPRNSRKKSQTTTWHISNIVNNRINYLSTGAGFLPLTLCCGTFHHLIIIMNNYKYYLITIYHITYI